MSITIVHAVFKVAAGAAIGLAVLVGLAAWKPVTASRLLWPAVEAVALRDQFVGITSDGSVRSALFPIVATGVSTRPVVDAARRFLKTLNDEQRARVMFPVDDLEWRRWANIHISTRQGVGFLEMNPAQAEAAFDLIASGLSPRGFRTARDVMRLEGHLADLKHDHVEFGEKRYWLTVMGTPSSEEPWGWQLEGHHLIVNYFVLGDQVVMTPTFIGAEPPVATTGRYAGTSILEDELAAGLALINALSPAQQSAAVIDREKSGNDNRGEMFQDNAVVLYRGVKFDTFDARQQALALALIRLYIDNIEPGHARVRLDQVVGRWNETYFAWIGGTGEEAVFYYRIHSPVVMIEYDHQKPVALDGPGVPSRDHVHTVVRTPNGNDYGKDLLRQHLAEYPH